MAGCPETLRSGTRPDCVRPDRLTATPTRLEGDPMNEVLTPHGPADDEHWMRRALALAAGAARGGEVPVGCVIVRDGVEIGVGANAPIREADSTAHAEINAIRAASRFTGNYRLTGTTLYATM